MTVLDRLACSQNRRDEQPNQALAREIAAARDTSAIREIERNLWNKDRNVQSDCLKVLYEIGYLEPALIAGYTDDFIQLLRSRNNRLVWGAMIALACIATHRPDLIFAYQAEIRSAMRNGSVITVENGVLALARASSANPAYAADIFPFLLEQLRTCRPKDVVQYAEKSLPAVNASNKTAFLTVLEKRLEDLMGSEVTRVRKVMKQAGQR